MQEPAGFLRRCWRLRGPWGPASVLLFRRGTVNVGPQCNGKGTEKETMWDEGREVEPRKGLDVSEGLRGWRWFSEWEAGREPTRLPRAGHR